MRNLFVIGALAVLVGCAGTPQKVAYNTLYSLEVATQKALDAYDTGVVKGVIPTNDVPRISALYNKFQASFIVALDAVQYNTNAAAPPNLIIESQDVVNAINVITGGAK